MSKLGVVFLTWRRLLQKDLVKHRMTLKQHFVLLQLTKNEFLYPSHIAEMLFCDRLTATVVIKNMEREKWITRQQGTDTALAAQTAVIAAGSLGIDYLFTNSIHCGDLRGFCEKFNLPDKLCFH